MRETASPDGATTTAPARPPRIVSVDALRGFDMFWIVGGEHVVKALEPLGGGVAVAAVTTQLSHVQWEGFRFYDLIFPLFLFLVGVSIVLSMDRTIATEGRGGALLRIFRRSVLLFAVGVIYYGGVSKPWPDVQVSGVLPRIALCYLFAATLYVLLPRRGIVIAAMLCLSVYWALLTFVPFPDVSLEKPNTGKRTSQASAETPAAMLANATGTVRGTFEEGHNLTHYVDFRYLPGKKRNLYYTNEGLLSTIPAVATTLFGIMAGWVLVNARMSGQQKVTWLLLGGAAAVALGLLWGLQFPIIKRIWTSSYCLLASGCSAMLLGVFYLLVDVWRWQKWCVPFLWIGTNALTIYLVFNLVDFNAVATRFVGGDVKHFLDTSVAKGAGGLVLAAVTVLLPVLLVRFLYQRKIFIRL